MVCPDSAELQMDRRRASGRRTGKPKGSSEIRKKKPSQTSTPHPSGKSGELGAVVIFSSVLRGLAGPFGGRVFSGWHLKRGGTLGGVLLSPHFVGRIFPYLSPTLCGAFLVPLSPDLVGRQGAQIDPIALDRRGLPSCPLALPVCRR